MTSIGSEQGMGFSPAAPPLSPPRRELLPIPPHNRGGRFEPDADTAAVIDIGALRGNAPDDILRGQYRCHRSPPRHAASQATQLSVLNVSRPQACSIRRVIPEIDIWRAATLMLKRYGDKALDAAGIAEDRKGWLFRTAPRHKPTS